MRCEEADEPHTAPHLSASARASRTGSGRPRPRTAVPEARTWGHPAFGSATVTAVLKTSAVVGALSVRSRRGERAGGLPARGSVAEPAGPGRNGERARGGAGARAGRTRQPRWAPSPPRAAFGPFWAPRCPTYPSPALPRICASDGPFQRGEWEFKVWRLDRGPHIGVVCKYEINTLSAEEATSPPQNMKRAPEATAPPTPPANSVTSGRRLC